MKNHIRVIDGLGRIAIPQEITNSLGWCQWSKISVTKAGSNVVLKTFKGVCCLCGTENNLIPMHSTHLCQKCIDKIKES
ncbi:MAG: hypothetical protein LBM65_07850 [Oscillospiraceae bacterium]|jgi:bifunctional DNA-binding transcriptional regulator/antitoxin component of YhaV-PrlF toxin-antitoxin module|nr:hypothetical protein [Oscillospiraceae bacterium]